VGAKSAYGIHETFFCAKEGFAEQPYRPKREGCEGVEFSLHENSTWTAIILMCSNTRVKRGFFEGYEGDFLYMKAERHVEKPKSCRESLD
jgi:hypothetical protein